MKQPSVRFVILTGLTLNVLYLYMEYLVGHRILVNGIQGKRIDFEPIKLITKKTTRCCEYFFVFMDI